MEVGTLAGTAPVFSFRTDRLSPLDKHKSGRDPSSRWARIPRAPHLRADGVPGLGPEVTQHFAGIRWVTLR